MRPPRFRGRWRQLQWTEQRRGPRAPAGPPIARRWCVAWRGWRAVGARWVGVCCGRARRATSISKTAKTYALEEARLAEIARLREEEILRRALGQEEKEEEAKKKRLI